MIMFCEYVMGPPGRQLFVLVCGMSFSRQVLSFPAYFIASLVVDPGYYVFVVLLAPS